jgi:hypothetical protein
MWFEILFAMSSCGLSGALGMDSGPSSDDVMPETPCDGTREGDVGT